jgi:ATP synthase protein I
MQGRDRGDAWRSANQAWDVISTLLSGILVWGGVGFVLDRWFGFERYLFLPIGMLLGVSVAFYVIYRRYGTEDR